MIRHSRFGLLLTGLVAVFAFTAAAADCPQATDTPSCATAAAPPDCPMVIFAQAVDASPAPDSPGAPPAPGTRPGRRQLEQFRMLKLLELLDLKPNQETDFLIAFKHMRAAHMEVMQERDSVLNLLADGLRDETLKGPAIYDLTARLEQIKQKHMRATENFLATAKSILTPEQFGRMVVFQERFEFELLDSLRSFREHRGRMRGPKGMGRNDDNRPPDNDGY